MEEKKRIHSGIKILIITLLSLILIYFGGYIYAGGKFLPRTQIMGVDVSGMTADEANEALKNQGLVIDVQQRAKNEVDVVIDRIDLTEAAMGEVEYDTARLIVNQDKSLWFQSFLKDTVIQEIKGKGSFDENRLKLAVGMLYCMRPENRVEPQSATLKPEGKTVVVVPEVEGNAVERNVAIEKVLEAANSLIKGKGTQKIDLTAYCLEPELREEDPIFQAYKEKMGKQAARTITISLTGDYREELDGAGIISFMRLEDDDLVVDDSKLISYAEELAERFYINRYEYVIYDDLVEKLDAALNSEEDEVVEPEWYINYPLPGSAGNGSPSFVEISIDAQHLWYYEKGELVMESPVVTGQPPKFSTPKGYYFITTKEKDARLKAHDYDVKVNYWMGFEYSGYYGLHDAGGRGAFGEQIYLEDGSHGCVNLPPDFAEKLFEKVQEIITEVFIY